MKRFALPDWIRPVSAGFIVHAVWVRRWMDGEIGG